MESIPIPTAGELDSTYLWFGLGPFLVAYLVHAVKTKWSALWLRLGPLGHIGLPIVLSALWGGLYFGYSALSTGADIRGAANAAASAMFAIVLANLRAQWKKAQDAKKPITLPNP
jgi:hypothetical protein